MTKRPRERHSGRAWPRLGRKGAGRLAAGFLLGLLLLGAWHLAGSGGSGTWKHNSAELTAPSAPTGGETGSGASADGSATSSPAESSKARTWGAPESGDARTADNPVTPLQLGGMLLGVLLLAAGAILLLRRALRRARLAPSSQRVLEVVDALPLGSQRYVYVLNLHGRTLVVGAGGERIHLLAEYGEDEWGAAEAEASAAPREEPGTEPAPVSRPRKAGTRTAAAGAPSRVCAGSGTTAGRAAGAPNLDQALKAYRAAGSEGNGRARREDPRPLPGVHRVPPRFRHLLDRALEPEADQRA